MVPFRFLKHLSLKRGNINGTCAYVWKLGYSKTDKEKRIEPYRKYYFIEEGQTQKSSILKN